MGLRLARECHLQGIGLQFGSTQHWQLWGAVPGVRPYGPEALQGRCGVSWCSASWARDSPGSANIGSLFGNFGSTPLETRAWLSFITAKYWGPWEPARPVNISSRNLNMFRPANVHMNEMGEQAQTNERQLPRDGEHLARGRKFYGVNLYSGVGTKILWSKFEFQFFS